MATIAAIDALKFKEFILILISEFLYAFIICY